LDISDWPSDDDFGEREFTLVRTDDLYPELEKERALLGRLWIMQPDVLMLEGWCASWPVQIQKNPHFTPCEPSCYELRFFPQPNDPTRRVDPADNPLGIWHFKPGPKVTGARRGWVDREGHLYFREDIGQKMRARLLELAGFKLN
jgi:hypothetical protein